MIKIERLAKAFGQRRAVDDISFTVERGEVLGFLGPNGAGKSTTMRMITGFMPPTAGRVTVGGYDVLIMDEPTDGLDPNQKHEVRNLIRKLGKNKAIVFSTHILEEVDAACTRAIIIDRGRIVANGTPDELRAMSELAGAVTLSARGATEEKLAALGRVERLDGAFRIYPRDKANAAELAQGIVGLVNREGWKVEGMYSEAGQPDDGFRRITPPDTVKR